MARKGKSDKGRLYSPSVLRRQSNTRRDKIAWVLNQRGNANDGSPGPPGADAIPMLLPNHVTDVHLAPTGTVTTLETVPSDAFACAPGYLRNEGTVGNWLISFGGNTPGSSSYSVKLGPGDITLLTLGEAYKEAQLPVGTIKAKHDNPSDPAAGVLSGFIAWNDGTSPLVGLTGPQGPYGGAITIDYKFDTGTSNADPGAGLFRLNNATENTATALYIDTTSFDGLSLATLLGNLTNSTNTNKAVLRIVKKTDVTKALWFYVTGYTSHTGYKEFAITIIASTSASPFSNSDECLLCFSQIGDVGATGLTGAAGATGATGAAGPGYTATSVTSLATAGSGSKSFTTQAGLAYTVGARIRATSAGTGEFMEGVVTSYSGTTLVATMDLNSGTGTHADWNINLAGQQGQTGANGGFVQFSGVKLTSGNVSITSASFTDVTGLSVTITTGAHRCLITFIALCTVTTGSNGFFTLVIDGTSQGGTNGMIQITAPSGTDAINPSFTFITPAALSAGSHTFKIQAMSPGTLTVFASATAPAFIQVVEMGI